MNLLNSAESRERQGDGRGPGCPGAVSSLRNHHKTSGLDLWIILPLCFFMGRKQLLPGLLLLRMATAPGVVTASSSAMLMKKREKKNNIYLIMGTLFVVGKLHMQEDMRKITQISPPRDNYY